MLKRIPYAWKVAVWQVAFITLGSTWLYAPLLNTALSNRTTLISEYETPTQPYAWLFRLTDILSALLLTSLVVYLIRFYSKFRTKTVAALGVIGVLMLIDPLATTSCAIKAGQCIEITNFAFYVHAVETVVLSVLLLGLSAYNAWRGRRLPSLLFVIFQLGYAVFSMVNIAGEYQFGTVSQYVYQLVSIIWLAWFVGEVAGPTAANLRNPNPLLARLFGGWAFFNGVLALVLSLVHIRALPYVKSIYFAGDTAWLAQHSVVVGLLMLYLSRHLMRREYRARQLFLVLLFMEVIKYASISPKLALLQLYSVSFAVLFAARPYFSRGSERTRFTVRLWDAAVLVAGLLAATIVLGLLVMFNKHVARVVSMSFDHFENIYLSGHHAARYRLQSRLFAHVLTALGIFLPLLVLWSLFQPGSRKRLQKDQTDRSRVYDVLRKHSASSEDYFKYWPADKAYFWPADKRSFVAYKHVRRIVFALADPVGPDNAARQKVLDEFVGYWRAQGNTVCFLAIPTASLNLYEKAGIGNLQIGSEAIVDVKLFSEETVRDKWWRWQMNRAKKAGYIYETALPPHSEKLIESLRTVSDAWLRRPGHREQSFALGYFDDEYLQSCVIHFLRNETGDIIAFANQPPVFKSKQVTVDLIRFLPDANNAMPYLLASIILKLSEQGQYRSFDLGFVPLANMDARLAKTVKRLAGRRFSAQGLAQFKNKFNPDWKPVYLAYDGDIGDLAAIALELEQAFKPTNDKPESRHAPQST